jgi:hypothetical protein
VAETTDVKRWPLTVPEYVEVQWVFDLQVWLRCLKQCTSCTYWLPMDEFVTFLDVCQECVIHRWTARWRGGNPRTEHQRRRRDERQEQSRRAVASIRSR